MSRELPPLKCPVCYCLCATESDSVLPVTLWGNDGAPLEVACEECGSVLLVEEIVDRTWILTEK